MFRATGVQTEGDGGGIGLIIGHKVLQGHLAFWINLTGQVAYLQRHDPEPENSRILTGRSDLTNLPQRGQPFTLEVRAQGQQIRASLNGTVILEAHDPRYESGYIALGVAADRSSGPVTVQWQTAEVHHLGG